MQRAEILVDFIKNLKYHHFRSVMRVKIEMKRILLILAFFMLIIKNVEARKCLEGAVFDVDDNGQAILVSCEKWERDVEAEVAEQAVINAYTETTTSGEDNVKIYYDKPDQTPLLGRIQNKINAAWHSLFQ